MGIDRIRINGFVALAFWVVGVIPAGAQVRFDAEAVRLNNRGVAQMGQQFTEKAADSFAEAFKKNPKLAQAYINEGIALMTLQKLDEAKKSLQQGIALDPTNPQAWYNLGLAQHAANELEPALASFQQAVKLDPQDVDSYYFEGVCYQELKQFDKAIAILQKALAVNPIHASSEFALARALQRSGRTPEAKDHFKRFQHLTSTKISAAIGLAYGEQGRYSTVTPIEEPESPRRAMIPVKLVPTELIAKASLQQPSKSKSVVPATSAATGGACMMDVTGSGLLTTSSSASSVTGASSASGLNSAGAPGVPEPSSILLVVLGSLACLVPALRRKARKA